MKRACSVVLAAMALVSDSPVLAEAQHKQTVPAGYTGRPILRVPYGDTSNKVGVRWGDEDPESGTPHSVDCVQVLGDRIYLWDRVASRIKQFRVPGDFVWESESLDNLAHYAVAPDGKLYAVWGTSGELLSCIDAKGKLVWTASWDKMATKQQLLADSHLRSILSGFSRVDLSPLGLTVTIDGWDASGKATSVVALVSDDGAKLTPLPGDLVGSDGLVYTLEYDLKKAPIPVNVVGKDRKGKVVHQFRPAFGADRAAQMAGDPTPWWHTADPRGGILKYGSADVPGLSHTRTHWGADEVLWRIDKSGKVYEHWRFRNSKFMHSFPETIVGNDGCIYHLDFLDTGIEVNKYCKPAK